MILLIPDIYVTNKNFYNFHSNQKSDANLEAS